MSCNTIEFGEEMRILLFKKRTLSGALILVLILTYKKLSYMKMDVLIGSGGQKAV